MRRSLSLTYPIELLLADLRTITPSGRPWLDRAAGECRFDSGLEWIAARGSPPRSAAIRLMLGDRLNSAPMGELRPEIACILQIGTGAASGHASAWGLVGRTRAPVERLFFPGSGAFHAGPAIGHAPVVLGGGLLRILPPGQERWSRTQGVLGESYWTIAGMRCGFVGLGRLNSQLLSSRLRFGTTSVILCDPDTVESHNLTEADLFGVEDIGQRKVEAVSQRISRHYPKVEVQAVGHSITRRQAMEAIRHADIILSAADTPAGRLVAGALAVAYGRILIDVGTLTRREVPSVAMVGDVRIIGPDRCLLCSGGVTGEHLGRQILLDPDFEARHRENRDWRAERAGSLHSLNQATAGVASRLLEDYIAGVCDSAWCHLEFVNGALEVTYPDWGANPSLPCACSIAGWGDGGIQRFMEILAERESATTRQA